MPWRIDPARIVPDAARELAALFPAELRSLVVYGSAAGDGFRPERSDVNLALVLDTVRTAQLGRVAQWWQRWRRHRVSVPLIMTTEDLDRSRDVFPLEFLDMQARHKTLAGAEVFTNLEVAPEAVRLECEREAKGKLVRLRALFIELAGSARDQRALMLDSRKTFLMVMRGLLHLRGEPWTGDGAAVVRAFERHYGVAMPVMAALGGAAPSDPIETRFEAYLGEVERLAELADREARPAA